MGRAAALALVLAAVTLGCGDTLVDHGAPVDLIGGGSACDPAACPAPDPSFTGARAACIGAPGAQICGYECTGGLLKCTEGCCQATIVAAGRAHTCAITGSPAPGALYCWGSNDSAQVISPASAAPALTPQKIFSSGVSTVALGASHTCAVVNGGVQCWGRNTEGQAPPAVSLGSPSALAAGAAHTCAIDGNAVRCWGGGAAGVTTVITSGANAIAAGADHTCAIDGSGVQCWGANTVGQLGFAPPPTSATNAVTVAGLGSGGTAAFAAGSNLSCAAASSPSGSPLNDALQCWGSGLGALLPGDPQLTPGVPGVAGASLIGFKIERLSVGRAHVCVKQAGSNSVKCLGSDEWGQLAGPPSVPAQALDVPGSLGAIAFAAGADHTCAVFASGGVFCWGRNDVGQLGNGTQVTPGVDDGQLLGTPVPVAGR